MATSLKQIETAITRFQAEVPKLAKLKLVFGLELSAGGLSGRSETEHFHIELPGPKVSEGSGEGERLRLAMPRTMFSLLAEEGHLVDWREAYFYGHLRVSGDERVKRLLGQAIGGP